MAAREKHSEENKSDSAKGAGGEGQAADVKAGDSKSGDSKSGPESLENQLTAAQAERDALSQKWLLAVADFDNYRRRVQKEAAEDRRYAILPLARDLLPALDNLHRALEAAKNGGDVNQLAQGVQMVSKQFDDILARHAVVPINALDQPFDPNLHQALSQQPAPGKPPMTVLAECERGYTIHDRVVRPATVIVSAPAQDDAG
ncbi:MAG TPA: nucleotide exchange factor GrpE [Planctomycetaceae bacterium]